MEPSEEAARSFGGAAVSGHQAFGEPSGVVRDKAHPVGAARALPE
jgi:hypothetical protein